ncbi:unannotated protein [freshwater metagenome]|uniref:Unannotated protein n=1 Tax=freshwater metagenome TaxID=449393 RepID=A0A6J7ANZ5_9ZZZZ
MHSDEPVVHQWTNHRDNPRTFSELHDEEDQNNKERKPTRDSVNHHPSAPLLVLFVRQMVFDHPRTSHGETGKDANRVERHEAIDLGSKHKHQRNSHCPEHQDSIRKRQPMPTLRQLCREKPITSDEAGEVRKAIKRRVPTRIKNEDCGKHDDEVEGMASRTLA